MGLRLTDALKLSAKNIVEHKGRSAATIVTISVLFGVLMAGNFLLNGIERTLLEVENSHAGGEVYAVADIRYLNQSSGTFVEMVNSIDELPEQVETRTNERKTKLIRERLVKAGGEVMGETWSYQATQPYVFVPLVAVEDLVVVDLQDMPEGKMPVLTSSGKLELSEDLADTVYLEDVLYPVGTVPTAKCENMAKKCTPTLDGENPLNYLLGQVDIWYPGNFILIDDGSGKAEEFMQRTLEWQVENTGYVGVEKPERRLVLKFENVAQAERYADTGGFLGLNFGEKEITYEAMDFRSGTFGTLHNFNTLKALLFLIEVGLIVVAVVISAMTFKHLIDQDAATVALYRSLGATTGNIYLVYFLYMLELCLLALVFCCLLAGGLVGIVAALNAGDLGRRLQEFYQLDTVPRVYFYSFDQYFWTVVVAVLVVAPLALAFSTHRFEESYVARKLKEDA